MDERYSTMPACINKDKHYGIYYLMVIVVFFVVGILYEINTIEKEDFEKKSNGILGVFVFIAVAINLVILNYILDYFNASDESRKFIWLFSHFLAYFVATILSPSQWPFWFAIGVLWEFVEGYTVCWPKNNIPMEFNGYPDIVSNIAGISTAMWIRSYLALKGQDTLPGLEKWNK